ncbi:unnamed protein product [Adineta ricciae]|uniref:Uncharacterized protein n=1 Tax=Adineta ricciae TaxID=249248 RepID=A0A815V9C2_ADIRI|nr:unnamed protein product [Adineta ricciae]CAF1529105.1 unnamed protein product [Adineta ricciae]
MVISDTAADRTQITNIIHGVHAILEQPFAAVVGFFLLVFLIFTILCFVSLLSRQSNVASILHSTMFIATLGIIDRAVSVHVKGKEVNYSLSVQTMKMIAIVILSVHYFHGTSERDTVFIIYMYLFDYGTLLLLPILYFYVQKMRNSLNEAGSWDFIQY